MVFLSNLIGLGDAWLINILIVQRKIRCHCEGQGRCDRNFSKVATARGFARGLLALAKCSARCDRNP